MLNFYELFQVVYGINFIVYTGTLWGDGSEPRVFIYQVCQRNVSRTT